MGEQLLTEATIGLSGPLAALIAVMAIGVAGALFIVWRHVERCHHDQQLLHARISAVKDDVEKLKIDVAYIRATLSAHLDRFREESKS